MKLKLPAQAHYNYTSCSEPAFHAVAIIDSPELSTIGSLIASTIQPITGVEQTLTCLAADT